MWGSRLRKLAIPDAESALPGRSEPMPVPERHCVSGRPLSPPYPDGLERAIFGMGCFWGAERLFWQTPGVWVTAVGYCGGFTPNPTYEEVCSGLTGHAEVVLVVYDPRAVRYEALLQIFWESHDPSQGMRQGNDVGTQYRSVLFFFSPAQKEAAERSRAAYEKELSKARYPKITTEIAEAPPFYFAEPAHQQYLAKNPFGYCGLEGTGVACPAFGGEKEKEGDLVSEEKQR